MLATGVLIREHPFELGDCELMARAIYVPRRYFQLRKDSGMIANGSQIPDNRPISRPCTFRPI
jgi:hypothetical protein